MKRTICLAMLVSMLTSLSLFSQTVEDFKIRTAGPGNLNYRKHSKRVVISDFHVKYQVALELKDSQKGGKMWRGGLRGDAKASLNLVLDGLDPDQLQKLTDQLYDTYVAELKAQGFEVASAEELWNHEAYEKNREERWELVPGYGPGDSGEYGLIFTRPTNGKFVVPKNYNGMYVGATVGKINNKERDFIYNSVSLVVTIFEDSQGELSKTLNRHAKAAQVKAETNFKISEESKVWFGMGTISPRGGVEVSDVINKQKFEAGQNADRDKLGTDYGVLRIWKVDDKEKKNYSTVECNPEKYLKGTELGANAFLKESIQFLVKKAN
ncbi:hypothetical protein OB69_14280 [Roseivirga seohaensis subsp. aquiponti]|uniref:Uncharacterized protein n=1 Tax=Roseivirga seohaensis subsp. aquiponti TaxID=1566026 RepID=A0A0L8AI05_9BACT|nr:hypothetical protein [Roseivirga seohaensis]KOF01906.1 hypothetical protein OB69_14280 [Roseivirga seohaensis subsp. aquiponti]